MFYYCLLLSSDIHNGNHEKVFKHLKKLNINNAHFRVGLNDFGVMHMYIRIPDDEVGKLPRWEGEPYLPVSDMDSGRGINSDVYDETTDGWIPIKLGDFT